MLKSGNCCALGCEGREEADEGDFENGRHYNFDLWFGVGTIKGGGYGEEDECEAISMEQNFDESGMAEKWKGVVYLWELEVEGRR